MKIELNKDECHYLEEILESYASNLRMELRRTERSVYKKELKEKHHHLEDIISKVKAGAEKNLYMET